MTNNPSRFQIGTLWRTRGGDKVMVVNVDSHLVGYNYGHAAIYFYSENGFYFQSEEVHPLDLISPWKDAIKVKQKVKIYKSRAGNYYIFSELEDCHTFDLVAIKEIELEVYEGEGL